MSNRNYGAPTFTVWGRVLELEAADFLTVLELPAAGFSEAAFRFLYVAAEPATGTGASERFPLNSPPLSCS